MSDSASLKVALVGPTHPYKGGVATHTTALAHELTEAGHEVTLVSWIGRASCRERVYVLV